MSEWRAGGFSLVTYQEASSLPLLYDQVNTNECPMAQITIWNNTWHHEKSLLVIWRTPEGTQLSLLAHGSILGNGDLKLNAPYTSQGANCG